MAAFDDSAFDDHERVVFCSDSATELKAIIAIHSTVLGPAAGGCRLWSYESGDAALHDALRLSQGMSYKNAMAGLKFGGGKAVIIKTPDFNGSDALFEKFGEFVEKLNGDYVTAEDVGMSVNIMEMIARKTGHVAGLTPEAGQAGGDPSPKTALGIFKGIEAAARFKLERDDLNGVKVAVQGAGHVGYYLCRYLSEAGAKLFIADIDEARAQRICDEFGATAAPLDEILFQDADVLAPCALGAILNEQSIPKLKVSIVAGGANNQLETHADGQRLSDAGILYAPDYVINGGGIINVSCEYSGGYSDEQVDELVTAIGPRLTRIFEEAAASGQPTNVIADDHARKIIAAA
jgi:leucine dehydrogenase